MFCSKCGAQNPENTKYCGNCGLDVSNSGVASNEVHNFSYYGKNWRGARLLPLGLWSGTTSYDVAVDSKYVYFLKFPNYSSAFWYGVLGLLLLNLVGLFIGAYWGGSVDTKKRASYRSAWIDANGKIISRRYEAVVFQKVSIEDVKDVAKFKSNSLVFAISGKNYIFRTWTSDFKNFLSRIQ